MIHILVLILTLGSGIQLRAAGTCLNDPNNSRFNNPVCTAGDVRIAQINLVSGPASCVAGTTIQVQLQATTVATSNQRYDVGYFIALNGNSAKTGDCYHDYLPPPLSTATTGAMSPYYDGDGDQCGDIKKGINTIRNIGADVSMNPNAPPVILNLLCQDNSGNGTVDVSACTSWDNNTKGTCMSVADAYPGTPSKCDCGVYELNIQVQTGCQSANDCEDNNPCTNHACVNHQCIYTDKPSGSPCNDGNLCNTNDQCDGSGQCIGTPVVCTGDICQNAGACDPLTGLCINPDKPDGTKCDNGDPCTVNDKCLAGECEGTPVVCNTPGICEENPGQCINGTCNYNDAPSGTPCAGGAGTCDGNGGCGEGDPCVTAEDCGVIECLTAQCINNLCTYMEDPNCIGCTAETVETDCLGSVGDNCIIASCDPNTFQCIYSSRVCSSNSSCLIDSCDPALPGGCFTTPDDSLCPVGDQCSEPICTDQGCELEPTTGNPCISNVPCEINALCNNGVCIGTNSCQAPDSCSTANCDSGQCVISSCLPPTFCNEATSTCAQCGPGHGCEGNLVCNENGICVGCEIDAQCISGDICVIGTCLNQECHYNLNQACLPPPQCLTDAQCFSQDQCVLGTCVDEKCEYSLNPSCLPPPECSLDINCSTGDPCILGTCVDQECHYSLNPNCQAGPQCQIDAQCISHDQCVVGSCVLGECQYTLNQECLPPPECNLDIHCHEGDRCVIGNCIDEECVYSLNQACIPPVSPPLVAPPVMVPVPTPVPVAPPVPQPVVIEPGPAIAVEEAPSIEVATKHRGDNNSSVNRAPRSPEPKKSGSCASAGNIEGTHLWMIALVILWMLKRKRPQNQLINHINL